MVSDDDTGVNISEWIANAIADCGVTVVYGGHGGALVPLVNAVVAHPKLTWVCARNEGDAATMAAAHAKYTGGLGVVIATSGPGATNLLTGLMEAELDRVALLAITGMKPTAQLGYAEFQDVNQSRIFASTGIEWSKDAASPHGVIPLLRDAVATAVKNRTCAHLAIPVDIQAAQSPLGIKPFCAAHVSHNMHRQRSVDRNLIEDCARTLVGANDVAMPRVIICVGRRACYNEFDDQEWNISETILDLAEALNAPVLTRLDAKGVVDENHPLAFGVVGVHGKPGLEASASLISTSDIVVSIGVDDETLLVCNAAGLQIRQVVEIEPDSVCLSTRFEDSHSLVGDIQQTCKHLTDYVETMSLKKCKKLAISKSKNVSLVTQSIIANRRASSEEELLEKFDYMAHNCQEAALVKRSTSIVKRIKAVESGNVEKLLLDSDKLWYEFQRANWQNLLHISSVMHYENLKSATSSSNFCHPAAVLKALSVARNDESLSPVAREAAIAIDVGDITLWAGLCLRLGAGSRTLYSERLGTMGYALCAGIAGILAKQEPAGAVVLAGDGGFQMSMQELATFQQHKRPGDKLLCIVFDNQVLGRVAFGFKDALGCELSGWDYVALAKSCGGDGARLDKSENADSVIRQGLEADGLFLIHVIVDPDCKADMAAFHSDSSLKVMNSG